MTMEETVERLAEALAIEYAPSAVARGSLLFGVACDFIRAGFLEGQRAGEQAERERCTNLVCRICEIAANGGGLAGVAYHPSDKGEHTIEGAGGCHKVICTAAAIRRGPSQDKESQ